MARMTKAEKEYAQRRIREIESKMLNKVRDKHTKEGTDLTALDKYDLIAKKKVKMRPKNGVKTRSYYSSSVDIDNFFDFEPFEDKTDDKAIEREQAPIVKEFKKAMDELMLGEAEKALELLQSLEKKYGNK